MITSRRKRGVAWGACLLGLTVQLTAWAEGGDVPVAFQDAGVIERVGRSVGLHAPTAKGRLVQLNPALLESETVVLNLEPGMSWAAEATRVEAGSSGDFVWEGRLVGEPLSEVRLVSRAGAVAGRIERPMEEGNVTYTLRPTAGGVSVLSELAPGDVPEGCLVVPAPVERRPQLQGGARLAAATYPPATEANPAVVDVLVVYTPATTTRYGGRAGVEAVIADAVASANTGYRNSGVYLSLNLVYAGEVPYREDQDMNHALARLANPTDGYMDTVSGLRETYGADLVVLIDQDANLCGVSYQMGAPSVLYASTAFSVVNSGCLSTFSFAHEVGHTMGSQHDRGNSVLVGAYPYSYGYRWCVSGGSGFRTVMGYPCSNVSVPRVNYYSNPRITFNGVPTGVPESNVGTAADNAKSLNNTAHIVEAFRARPLLSPATPTGLTATATSATGVALVWADIATNETSMVLERSLDSVNWSSLVTLGSNAVAHADSGLAPETTYAYRIRACNAAGCSPWSTPASTKTPAELLPPTALSAAVLPAGAIVLSWVEANTAATSHQVERAVASGPWVLVATIPQSIRQWTDTPVQAGVAYLYRLRASGLGGFSEYTTTVTAKAPVPIPAVPADVKAVPVSSSAGTAVVLTWKDLSSNATGFRIERSTNGLTFGTKAILGRTLLTYSDTSASMGTRYYYRVVALGSSENSAPSEVVSAVVPIPAAPAPPSGFKAIAGTNRGSVSLTWVDNTTNEYFFFLQYSKDGTNYQIMALPPANSTSYVAQGLTSGTRYYFLLRAVAPSGWSSWSTLVSVIVP